MLYQMQPSKNRLFIFIGECHPLQSSGQKDCFSKREECPPASSPTQQFRAPKRGESPPPLSSGQKDFGHKKGECPPPQSSEQRDFSLKREECAPAPNAIQPAYGPKQGKNFEMFRTFNGERTPPQNAFQQDCGPNRSDLFHRQSSPPQNRLQKTCNLKKRGEYVPPQNSFHLTFKPNGGYLSPLFVIAGVCDRLKCALCFTGECFPSESPDQHQCIRKIQCPLASPSNQPCENPRNGKEFSGISNQLSTYQFHRLLSYDIINCFLCEFVTFSFTIIIYFAELKHLSGNRQHFLAFILSVSASKVNFQDLSGLFDKTWGSAHLYSSEKC
ncbi:hypothetical protein EGR_05194 [Echinococcus granulosus]|uniref:Uncharacterized protein n=1 Tax=Echinococcus granulosus TaxID=6210 RepID=W6UGG1_ECHGR|nr:hypothetical protein EGR_05194 [Echinococcus granulosus]EUB60033.1 hypothetical protein EGR_05194 [Echinococcus granulosus]